jgi:uncharacterized protein (TIGR00304 family)
MNKFHFLSIFCLIFGIIFFGFGFLSGEVETGVFVVFPFLAGSGIYAFLGFIFIFIAFLLFMFGFSTYFESDEFPTNNNEFQPRKKTSVKGGGVILIGPIPIVIGSNWKIAIVLMIVAIIVILVAFFSFRYI